jgi:hypothetical protein
MRPSLLGVGSPVSICKGVGLRGHKVRPSLLGVARPHVIEHGIRVLEDRVSTA